MTRLTSVLVVGLVLLPTTLAHAAGFYLLPRGTRGVAQGGAVVAGSDDPGALWYNPAGLAYSGKQTLFDLVLPYERFDFTRINSGGETEQTITANAAPLPVPGIGYSHPLLDEELTLGVGLFAPTAALLQYPQGIRNPDSNAIEYPPQGFSIMSMDGSALVFVGGGLAWRPHKAFSVGAGFQLLVGQFQAKVLTYLADPALTSDENEYNVTPATFGLKNLIRPTGNVGVVVDFSELVDKESGVPPIRLGLSFALPVTVKGDGSFDITLPQSGPFAGAELSDNSIYMEMDFPWVARAGLEVRPLEKLRTELSFTYEAWSVQDAIRVQSDLTITGVPALESYTVGNLQMVRNLKDTWSIGLGGEYEVLPTVIAPLGFWYETSSMTDETMSPLMPDTEKTGISAGVAIDVMDGLWLDLLVGYLHMKNRNVPQGTNEIYRLEALRPELEACEPGDAEGQAASGNGPGTGCKVPLGDGKYELDAPFFGAGVRWEM